MEVGLVRLHRDEGLGSDAMTFGILVANILKGVMNLIGHTTLYCLLQGFNYWLIRAST